VPYQLGYATKELAAAARFELAHPRLQDECSVIQLSYAAIWWTGRDSNPHKKFAGLLCSRLHHQPEEFGGCGWSRTTNLALMRRLLYST
jgi:hypothetical protein